MDSEIQGFKVLPLKFQTNSPCYHQIFIKEHSVRKEDATKPLGRTLFLLNLPPYATKDSLKRIFSVVGDVQSVTLEESEEHGFKTGFVVYTKTSSIAKALKLKSLEPLSSDEHPVTTGLVKYIQDYNSSIMDPTQLQKEVNAFITQFDKQEVNRQVKEKQQKDDEEGWTVVTKRSRNPGLSRKESVEIKIAEKLRKKEKKKNIRNFYTFQIRESKMNHVTKLREKFEEDKKRIEAFKKSRKFKPF